MTVDLCPSCYGSGEADEIAGLDCPRCTGVGMVDDRDREWDGFVEADEDDTPEWAAEREADADIAAGRVAQFDSMDALFADLEA